MPDTKVPDDKFVPPDKLDKIPCVGSDRFLVRAPEEVHIQRVCQDSFDPSLVRVEFKLNGVLSFAPILTIKRIDSNTLDESKIAPLVAHHPDSDPVPLDTNCDKKTNFSLVFDFGSVITDFLEANVIEFELKLLGRLTRSLKLPKFRQLQTEISDSIAWAKGPTPNPIGLIYNEQNKTLLATFSLGDGLPCKCEILCRTLNSTSSNVKYCQDRNSTISLHYDPSDAPITYLFKFTDANNNASNLKISPVIGVTPAAPNLTVEYNPPRITVGASKAVASNGKELSDITAFQVWRYESSFSNIKLISDWIYRDVSTFIDTDVRPGRQYGYAVKLLGKFNDISNISEWSTITV